LVGHLTKILQQYFKNREGIITQIEGKNRSLIQTLGFLPCAAKCPGSITAALTGRRGAFLPQYREFDNMTLFD